MLFTGDFLRTSGTRPERKKLVQRRPNLNNPSNPATKNPVQLNDFGGSIGGPIIKDKFFVFGTFAESRQPGTVQASNWLFTPAAQSGMFTYVDTNNATQTVNLYTLETGQSSNVLSPATAAVFAAYPALSAGTVTPVNTGDPNVQQLNWQVSNPRPPTIPQAVWTSHRTPRCASIWPGI